MTRRWQFFRKKGPRKVRVVLEEILTLEEAEQEGGERKLSVKAEITLLTDKTDEELEDLNRVLKLVMREVSLEVECSPDAQSMPSQTLASMLEEFLLNKLAENFDTTVDKEEISKIQRDEGSLQLGNWGTLTGIFVKATELPSIETILQKI